MNSKIISILIFSLTALLLVNVVNAASNYVIIHPTSCTDSEGNCQLSNVQSQDGVIESQVGHASAVRFIETVNSNSSAITSPDSINNVTVYIDRFESGNSSGQTITLSVKRPSDNVATSCSLSSKLTNDSVYDGCDVTSLITGSSTPESDAEGLTISYRIAKLGATNTMYLDHGYVNITYTDSSPPLIILNSPTNNSWSNSSNVTFQFTPNDVTSGISSCTLVLNNALNQTNSSVTENQINYIRSSLNQGSSNWTINCTDTSANANVGTNASLRVINIDLTNTSIQLNSPVNLTNSTQPLQSFNFTATDNLAPSFTCRLFVNGTNVDSTTVTNSTPTILTYNLTEGMQQWYIQCEDLAINVNVSETRNITIDFTSPQITNISNTPSSEAGLDPNVTVNVTANVTDNVQVNQIILQYKLQNETNWNETSMTLLSGNLYRTGFNVTEGNWSYRIIANDTVGNQNISSITNLSVAIDMTWKNSTVFPSIKAIVQDEPRLFAVGNLTLNNTGDVDLNFTINSTQSWIGLNGTNKNLTVRVNNTFNATTFNVTANTTGFAVGEYNFNVTVYAFTINPSLVSSQTLSGKVVIQNVAGPYFTVTIVTYDATVTQGDTGINLSATVKNDGTGDATQAWLAWTLPSGWSNTSGTLNKSIDFLGIGTTVSNEITVSISSSAPTGTFTLIASTGSAENATGNDSKTVTVSAAPSAPSPTTSVGGGAAAPSITPEEAALLLQTNETLELVRGLNDTFIIKVANPFKDSNLTNISLDVKGFLAQYIGLSPEFISSIEYNKTGFFKVTITAPAYLTKGSHTLNFTIKGKMISGAFVRNIVEKRLVTLVVHEIGREEANTTLQQTEKTINQMKESGFSTASLQRLLDQAKKAFDERDYEKVKELSEKIISIKNTAFSTYDMIQEVKEKIKQAEDNGLRVDATKNLLNMALAAFEREDYSIAERRIKDAQLVYAIETVGKIDIVKFLIDNWRGVLVFLAIGSAAGVIVYRRLIVVIIARRLRDLAIEEANIFKLMKDAQRKTYVEKKMSSTEYHKAIYEHEKRLDEIKELRTRLRAKRVGIIKVSKELDNLKGEDDDIISQMKNIQKGYFEKRSINKAGYDRRMEALRLRRAEIEDALAVLETKLTKEKRLRELKKLTFAEQLAEKIKTLFKRRQKEIKKKPEEVGKIKEAYFGKLFTRIKKFFKERLPRKKIVRTEPEKTEIQKIEERIAEKVEEVPVEKIPKPIPLSKSFGKLKVRVQDKLSELSEKIERKLIDVKHEQTLKNLYREKSRYDFSRKFGHRNIRKHIELSIKRLIGKIKFKLS